MGLDLSTCLGSCWSILSMSDEVYTYGGISNSRESKSPLCQREKSKI
jgi:hypothetical protein